MLKEGDKVPVDIKVLNSSSEEVSLKNYLGKYVVLYFYPKDNTPGCTKEACSFRDSNSEMKEQGIVVIGVSADKPSSHQKFSEKFGLNFELWSDVDKKLAEAFGVYGEKKFLGKIFLGVKRITFLIGPAGNIFKVWEKVKPEGHAEEVFEYIKNVKNL